MNKGKYPILVLDYNGVRSLKSKLDYPVFAFYVYTSLKEAESRLTSREIGAGKAGASEIIAKRCLQNKADYLSLGEVATVFDAFVENNSLDECYREIVSALQKLLSGEPYMSDERKIAFTDAFRAEALGTV